MDNAPFWVLLIYTVPSEPSRKRAFIWREVKRIGAVYLRDGVCILPETGATVAAFGAICAQAEEFGGQATVVQSARLDPDRASAVVSQSRADRAAEYGEIAREAEGFLDHIRRETDHRDLDFAELEALEEDLGKLRRWTDQVRGRDYFGSPAADRVAALLRDCEEALGVFMDEIVTTDRAAL
jgi:hypothetical protein